MKLIAVFMAAQYCHGQFYKGVHMPNWCAEFLIVFAMSKRFQWALIFAMAAPVIILIIGDLAVANFELHGVMKQFEEVFIEKIFKRFDKLALFTFISFSVLAVKFYFKDRRRL